MKKEEQNDLLEMLRRSASNGLTIVNDAMLQKGRIVAISETHVKRAELVELVKLLKEVEAIQTIEQMKKVINEESIPVELIVTNRFWGNFQELIYQLEEE